MLRFYARLIRLRNELQIAGRWPVVVEDANAKSLRCEYLPARGGSVLVAFNFGDAQATLHLGPGDAPWRMLLDSAAPEWAETLPPSSGSSVTSSSAIAAMAPHSVRVLVRENPAKEESLE